MRTYRLVIKSNNTATNDPCAICGKRTDPDIGPELFLDGTWSLVCYECGKKYAPDLMMMLDTWHETGGMEKFMKMDFEEPYPCLHEPDDIHIDGEPLVCELELGHEGRHQANVSGTTVFWTAKEPEIGF